MDGTGAAHIQPDDAAALGRLLDRQADPPTGEVEIDDLDPQLLAGRDDLRALLADVDEQRDAGLAPDLILVSGDIAATPRIKGATTNDTICQKDKRVLVDPIPFSTPTHTVAVCAAGQTDEEKVTTGITRLQDFDPTLQVRVAGYSAYFVNLSRDMQDHLIAHCAHTL